MYDVEFAEDGGCVGGEDHLLQVVDDDLVASVWTERGLDGLGNGAAGIDVAEDSSIFGIVTAQVSVGVFWNIYIEQAMAS